MLYVFLLPYYICPVAQLLTSKLGLQTIILYLCNVMTYEDLWRRLTPVYDVGEAKAIVRYVLDVRFGMSATDVYCGKVTQLAADECIRLEEIMRRLAAAEPVQYVLGRADFCGRSFRVAPGVLIPRPETEELCDWVAADASGGGERQSVLDIGTGSGCIAITLSLNIPDAAVTAWDVSEAALAIARRNAAELGASVDMLVQDALRPPRDERKWDVIVSNPPYICRRESAAMERNVLEYEPPTALFVPDDDPLLFYRAIAGYAREALRHDGALYFEINPLYSADMLAMLREVGFGRVETRRDCFGKERMMRATNS